LLADRKPCALIHIWRSIDDRIEVDELTDVHGDLWTRIDAIRDLNDYAMGATILDGDSDQEAWHAQFGHEPSIEDMTDGELIEAFKTKPDLTAAITAEADDRGLDLPHP